MPHVTIKPQQSSSPEKNYSWSSEFYKFMLLGSKHKRSETETSTNHKRNVDQKTLLARLGLIVSQPNNSTPTNFLSESCLTRSPIRSQISRGISQAISFRNLADVDFSSKLGQLLINHLNATVTLENNETTKTDAKQERYFDGMDSNGRSHVLRTRANVYPITYTYNKKLKKKNYHLYCFNKAQRQERKRTLRTGLNKRSRILKRQCKPCSVVLERVNLKSKRLPDISTLRNGESVQPAKPNPATVAQRKSFSKQLKINNMFNKLQESNDKMKSDLKSEIGKEIIIDGSVVIDLCSDDESDIIISPKSHTCSSAASGSSENLITRSGTKAVQNDIFPRFVNNSSKVKLQDCKVTLRDIKTCIAPDGQIFVRNTQLKNIKCNPKNISSLFAEIPTTNHRQPDTGLLRTRKAELVTYSSKTASRNCKRLRLDGKSSHINTGHEEFRQHVPCGMSSKPKVKLTTTNNSVANSSKNNSNYKALNPNILVVKFKCHICNYIGYMEHTLLKKNIDNHVYFYHGGYQNIILVRRISHNTGHVVIEVKSDCVQDANGL